MKEIRAIKKWLKKNGNSQIKLGKLLGYNSHSTVNNWIFRGRVPNHMRQRLMEVINANN